MKIIIETDDTKMSVQMDGEESEKHPFNIIGILEQAKRAVQVATEVKDK